MQKNQSSSTSAPQSEKNPLRLLSPKGFPGLPENWVTEVGTFKSADGELQLFTYLFYKGVHKEDWTSPRAALVLHGLGEHGGRYAHLPHYLQDQVQAVYCLDHRGHGRSEGLRGHVETFDSLVEDAVIAYQILDKRLKDKFGHSEIHLIGHSLGGHVGLRLLFNHPELQFKSATISAPFLAIKAKVPYMKKLAAQALAKVWGSLQLSTGLDVNAISHDSAVVEVYQKDRLVHDRMTTRFYDELRKTFVNTLRREGGIEVPLLFIVPLSDALVDSDVTLEFYKNLSHRDKRLKTYPGFFHESLNEIGKEEVFAEISNWIAGHP